MALSRVDGPDELYVGGIFGLRSPASLQERGITHILSMIKYSLDPLKHGKWEHFWDRFVHLSIDVDDVEDEDLLVSLSRTTRFIEMGVNPECGFGLSDETAIPTGMAGTAAHSSGGGDGDGGVDGGEGPCEPDAITPAPPNSAMANLDVSDKLPVNPGGVYVHCAMGKSRSVAAVVAWLLWKYPHRYGLPPARSKTEKPVDEETAEKAVMMAVKWVRKTRGAAEPNPGFMEQLQMWVRMGMPTDTDDAVEKNGAYQRWVWEREVAESAKVGRAPDWIRFEDEVAEKREQGTAQAEPRRELRCKKCRRVLATDKFIVQHRKKEDQAQQCPHYFVEALSWMRPVLEEGQLDGRLICPNAKCGASVGRYSWQGFKCSCGEWVCPAFSLQASKVDEVAIRSPGAVGNNRQDPRSLGIRLPPGAKQNL